MSKKSISNKAMSYVDPQTRLNEYARSYNEILNSTSWKITKPLRVIMRKLKRLPPEAELGSITINDTSTKPIVTELIHADDLEKNIHPRAHAIPSFVSIEKPVRLNFVTDSINARSALGGVVTALIIATLFAKKQDIPLRIITRSEAVDASDYFTIMKICNIEPAQHVTFFSDFDSSRYGESAFKIDISENDIFFATSWWSAYAIKQTTLRKRFYYIIQEVETFFYTHGVDHFYCSQIMNDPNIDFIINSKYLSQYFQQHFPNVVKNGITFEPAFPLELYSPKGFPKKDKFKLFFYARPNNDRNMFTYGVRILNQAIIEGVLDTELWDIYCAGDDIPHIQFNNGYISKNMGLMNWKEYGDFLKDIDLTLSLMYTPHPSYPPYDSACSGCVVVSNQFDTKQYFDESDNVILSKLDMPLMLQALESGIRLAKDSKCRQNNYENSTIKRDWKETAKDVMQYMEECLRNV